MHCGAEVTESSTNKQHHLLVSQPVGARGDGVQEGSGWDNHVNIDCVRTSSIRLVLQRED